jgi:flavin-dependent dehydrogenase
MTTDCVVVGAGPAGSTTALLLARAGLDVVVLDSKQFPRPKPCGDCLSPQANLLLAELGLLPAVLAQKPAQLRGWRIVAPAGHSFCAHFADSAADPRLHAGLALPREQLDALLLAAAAEAGASVWSGFRCEQVLLSQSRVQGVLARAPDGTTVPLHARLTVGADGLRSTVRQRLGLAARAPRLRKVALTAHAAGVTQLTALGELHLGDGVCVGLAPINAAADTCNITLVVDAHRFGRTLAGKSHDRFCAWLAQFSHLRERTSHLELQSELLAAGPFDRPARTAAVPGAALVGDAAGYYDPFTGQGIFQSLAGARLLANAVLTAWPDSRALRAYARAQRRLVRGVRRVQQLIEFVCARPARADRCIAALAQAPAAAAALIAVTGDLQPAHSLLSPVTLLSFLLGFSTRSGTA